MTFKKRSSISKVDLRKVAIFIPATWPARAQVDKYRLAFERRYSRQPTPAETADGLGIGKQRVAYIYRQPNGLKPTKRDAMRKAFQENPDLIALSTGEIAKMFDSSRKNVQDTLRSMGLYEVHKASANTEQEAA